MRKIKSLKQFIITLIVGAIPTIICYTLNWWWGGTIFLLLTFFALGFALMPGLYTFYYTLYVGVVIAFLTGGLISDVLLADSRIGVEWRPALGMVGGLVAGIAAPVLFWLPLIYISATWILDMSGRLDIPLKQAMGYLFSGIFQTRQRFMTIDDGKMSFDNTGGLLSSFGGPGLLIVSPGHAAALQSGGRFTRVVGPGIQRLDRFENFMQPRDAKGIIDLRPQFAGAVAEEVRTKDGIPLKMTVGEFFQLEPTYVTDQRPESHYEGGDATSKVIGGPEYPVYEAIIKKALFKIPRGGFKTGWFPGDPITRLRDVVITYTLDEIFTVSDDDPNNPRSAVDRRVIKRIEDEVQKQFNPVAGGVWFKGIDIREITMPPDIEAQMVKRWTQEKQMRLQVARAEAERDAVIALSEGRAKSLAQMIDMRTKAWDEATRVFINLLRVLEEAGHKQEAWNFVNVIRQLTLWVGQDDTAALRYVEAMRGVIEGEGHKSIVVYPPRLSAEPPSMESTSKEETSMRGQTASGEPILEISEAADADDATLRVHPEDLDELGLAGVESPAP